jgi:hypothetical protein
VISDWGNIKIDEDKVWKDSVNELKTNLILMNQEQLKQGFDSTGTKLPPYSSPYAKKKRKSLQPKTLNDTGAFYKGFYVLAFDKFIEMGSKDWKEAILENNWGKIHGLTEENLQEFRTMFLPIYTRNITNAILQA